MNAIEKDIENLTKNIDEYGQASDHARSELIQAFRKASKDDPTIIKEVAVAQLAAYIYLRENKILPQVSRFVGQKIRHLSEINKIADQLESEQAYQQLVDKIAAGPFWFSPFFIPSIHQMTLSDYYIHTQDIIRAKDASEKNQKTATEETPQKFQDILWNEIISKGSFLYRGTDVGTIAVSDTRQRHVIRKNPQSVAIIGKPSEILMHAYRRSDHADVSYRGSDDAIIILNSSMPTRNVF